MKTIDMIAFPQRGGGSFNAGGLFYALGLSRQKSGFTLAEVLITLGVIGVVAAMTLPALVTDYKGNILKTQLQKSYSVIQNALQMMNNEQGFVAKPGSYAQRAFITTYKKYLLVASDCNSDKCESRYEENEDGDSVMTNNSSNYKTYNNKKLKNQYLDDGQLILPDGSFIMVQNEEKALDGTILISVDVNGIYKKPNRWGHDLFTFQIMDDGKLLPMGSDGTLFDNDTYCSGTSSSSINGIACTYRALTEKDYFKNLPK